MHDKLETSEKSLTSWVDKIFTDSKGTSWRLRNFIATYNIQDFRKFYLELQPHILQLRIEDPDMFENLVSRYEQNSNLMSETMNEHFLFHALSRIGSNLPYFGRSANDLIEVLRQIHSNAKNLESSLKIFRS